MLVLEKQERGENHQMFYTVVQLVGTRKQAENFAYRFVFGDLLSVLLIRRNERNILAQGSHFLYEFCIFGVTVFSLLFMLTSF